MLAKRKGGWDKIKNKEKKKLQLDARQCRRLTEFGIAGASSIGLPSTSLSVVDRPTSALNSTNACHLLMRTDTTSATSSEIHTDTVQTSRKLSAYCNLKKQLGPIL